MTAWSPYHGADDNVSPAQLERFFDTLARTVSVDFDGVIHPYTDGWCGSAPADEPPVNGVDHFLRGLKRDGYRIVISSCRADHPEGLAGIWNWLAKYDLRKYIDDVTHLKPPAVAYVDDRAVKCKPVGDPEEFQRVALAVDLLAAGRHQAATGAAG